jgi:hypothetical protein
MASSETLVQGSLDRRLSQRRAAFDRRFAERRCPERAQLGRRVLQVDDRRMTERRESEKRHPRPELWVR